MMNIIIKNIIFKLSHFNYDFEAVLTEDNKIKALAIDGNILFDNRAFDFEDGYISFNYETGTLKYKTSGHRGAVDLYKLLKL